MAPKESVPIKDEKRSRTESGPSIRAPVPPDFRINCTNKYLFWDIEAYNNFIG